MPKISVLMGVYNPTDEDMLRKAVYSILNQSFKDFELIICNDCSNEESTNWIKKLINQDNRIIYIENKKNMGLAYTLNHCFENSSGEYIARQDADDYSNENRFAKQSEFLDNNREYAMVGSNIKLFNESGVYSSLTFPEFPNKESFLFSSPFNHGSIMIRRDVFKLMNGYTVSKRTLRCEDYDLFMRMYIAGFKGYNLQEPLYYYREDDAAVTRRKLKYRIDEATIKAICFKKLGIGFKRYLYIAKPILAGFIPKTVLKKLRQIYYRKRRI